MSGYLSADCLGGSGTGKGTLIHPFQQLEQAFVTTGYRFSARGQILDYAAY